VLQDPTLLAIEPSPHVPFFKSDGHAAADACALMPIAGKNRTKNGLYMMWHHVLQPPIHVFAASCTGLVLPRQCSWPYFVSTFELPQQASGNVIIAGVGIGPTLAECKAIQLVGSMTYGLPRRQDVSRRGSRRPGCPRWPAWWLAGHDSRRHHSSSAPRNLDTAATGVVVCVGRLRRCHTPCAYPEQVARRVARSSMGTYDCSATRLAMSAANSVWSQSTTT
jgi:hypothetical protein